jgi:hypothetical protein
MPPKRITKVQYAGYSGAQVDGLIRFILKEKKNNITKTREALARQGCKVSDKRISGIKNGKKQTNNAPAAGKNSDKQKELKKRRAIVKSACDSVIKRFDDQQTYENTSTTHIQEVFRKKKHVPPSKQTILRDIKAIGYVIRRRPPRAHIGTAKVMLKRLNFALAQIKRKQWKQNIFSDEHYITSNFHGPQYAFVPKGTKTVDMHPVDKSDWRNKLHLQCWGAIGFNWKSKLVNISRKTGGRINTQVYKLQCLSPHRVHLSAAGKRFQQDGARYHTAKVILNYCNNQNIKLMENWPPYSPDLNPIEQVWAYLDREVERLYPEGSGDKAIRFKQYSDTWEAIPMETINNFVLSFEDKVKACKEANGD